MNIIYAEKTEVPFYSIFDGECFSFDQFIYMKFHCASNVVNAINLELGTAQYFDNEASVTPVYAELYVTGYNKEKT